MSRSTKAPRRRPASGFYGVTKQRSNWNARINIIDGQQRLHCGSFGTKEEAALAYDRAAREHRPDLPTNYESIEAAEAAAAKAKEFAPLQAVIKLKMKRRLKKGACKIRIKLMNPSGGWTVSCPIYVL